MTTSTANSVVNNGQQAGRDINNNYYNYKPSEFQEVLEEISKLRNSHEKGKKKIPKKPYSINDKINKNKIGVNNVKLSKDITKYHIDHYDIVSQVYYSYQETNRYFWEDITFIYEELYSNIIGTKSEAEIIEESDNIYIQIVDCVTDEIYPQFHKKTKLQVKRFVEIITSYVFYKCTFLIGVN